MAGFKMGLDKHERLRAQTGLEVDRVFDFDDMEKRAKEEKLMEEALEKKEQEEALERKLIEEALKKKEQEEVLEKKELEERLQ